mgnify:CR=1 FL=1
MVSSEIRKIYEQSCRNEYIFNILECYKSSKNIALLPYHVARMSVSIEIPEKTKNWIITSILPEYANSAISSKTIYESAFIGNDFLFGSLFEKGFITESGIREYLLKSDLLEILNTINKNFCNNQRVERITNFLISSLNQTEKQKLFENLLKDFKTHRNIFAIKFLLNMYKVKIPETINIVDNNNNRYLKHLDESDTFAYFANLYLNSINDEEKKAYGELLSLLNYHGVPLDTVLRFINAEGEWCFINIKNFTEKELKDIIGCNLNFYQEEKQNNKVCFSVFYFCYYDFSCQIDDISEFKYYAIKDVIEYGKKNNVYILDVKIDHEKMVIQYSCDKSIDVDLLTANMRNELCNGNYYQVLFPSLFLTTSNIWIEKVYTEENTITEEALDKFRRKYRQLKFLKRHR